MPFHRRHRPPPARVSDGRVEFYEWVAPTAEELSDGRFTPPPEPGPIDLTWPEPPDPRYGPYQPYSVTFEADSHLPADDSSGTRWPRRFRFERLPQAADDLIANEFLLELCGYGMRTQASEFHWSPDRWADYKVAHALFAHRFCGRFKIRRHLRCPGDFFEAEGPQAIRCLVPGVDTDPQQFPKNRLPSQREYARALFEALGRPGRYDDILAAVLDHLYDLAGESRNRRASGEGPAPATSPRSVGEFMRQLAESGTTVRDSRTPRGPLQELRLVAGTGTGLPSGLISAVPAMGVGHIGTVSFFDPPVRTGGLSPARVADGVRSAVVGSHCSPDDVAAVLADRRDRGDDSAYDRLLRALRDRAGGPDRAAFGRWLRRELSRGFESVLPPGERDSEFELVLLLKAFALLQWASIELMAECYGATAAMINADFWVGSPAASEVEGDLFTAMHLRHAALGGLPLCFLGAAARDWAAHRFVPLLTQEVVATASQRYTCIHTIDNSDGGPFYDIPVALGLYGDLVREVRAADQRRKVREAARARRRPRRTTSHD